LRGFCFKLFFFLFFNYTTFFLFCTAFLTKKPLKAEITFNVNGKIDKNMSKSIDLFFVL